MQQRIINILFGVIIVILTGTVIYLTFGNKSTPATDTTPAPVKTTVKPPVVATDETADWKTYTHTELGYSFKYPSTYTIKTIGSEVQIYETPTTTDGQWVVSVHGTNIKDQGGILKDLTLGTIVKEMMDSQSLSEAKPTTINGIPAYEGVVPEIVNWYGGPNWYGVLFENNLNLFEILFNSTDKGNLQLDKAALTNIQKQILSTFKFISQTSDSATANWQVYSNEKLGFELKYPTDWRVIASEDGATFGPISIGEDTLFGVYMVSKIPALGTKEDNYEITKVEMVPFDGYQATKVYTRNPSVGMEWTNLYIEKNGVVLSVGQPTLNNSNFPFENKYNNVINQILSTFKFTK